MDREVLENDNLVGNLAVIISVYGYLIPRM
jgi:hypothetical protein